MKLRLPSLAGVARSVARIRAPLSVKLQVAFLLIITVVLATGLVSLVSIGWIDRQAVDLEKLDKGVTLAQELAQSIVLQEQLASMVILTGAPSYEEKLALERHRFQTAVVQLRGDEVGRGATARLAEAYSRFETTLDVIGSSKRAGFHQYAQDLHVKVGQVVAEEIEDLTRGLVAQMEAHRQAGLDKIVREQRQANWNVGGLFLLCIALAVALGSLVARSIVHPIRQVNVALERIAKGDFERVTDVANRDELGSLAGHLNQMSQQLAALYWKERQAARQLQDQFESLQRTQTQLIQSEKLRALGEMAGGVAHDFNNLLAVILGQAQLLLRKQAAGGVTREEAERRFGIVEQAALDGAKIVRRLMEFTRAAPRPSELEVISVKELFASVLAAAQPRWKDEANAEGRQIEVVTQFREVPPILGNPAELREVLLNLIFNALDAMPNGGRLTLSSWRDGKNVCLVVTDTGVGMPEAIVSRVFEPFFTTKGPNSSGLGLSVSYGVIRRHQGDLSVRSRPGQGATFTIRIPMCEVPPARLEAAADATRASAAPESGLRVLVVDDEPEVRNILGDILADAGHQVSKAGSGSEALEVLEKEPMDLVCTDLGMPGMTGWQLADRIWARSPRLKVGLITGWGARIEPEELRAHHVDFLIAKPFNAREVLQAVAETHAARA
jgi:signal transduction histidine kinase/ActR/RegA family two-component response regulator